jgi:hypothetical protein
MTSPHTTPESKGFSWSNGIRNETVESRFIRLLTILSKADGPVSTDENTSGDDLRALTELYLGRYISTTDLGRDTVGQVCYLINMEIKPSGRAHLDELNKKAEAKTSIGLIKQNRFPIYKWFFAILATIIAGYIVWHLTH